MRSPDFFLSPPVFISGWAMSPQSWTPLMRELRLEKKMPAVFAAAAPPYRADKIAHTIAAKLTARTFIVAHSLGALIALQIARHHEISGLCLIGATARFCVAADWPTAMPPEVFGDFLRGLRKTRDAAGREKILRRFHLLCAPAGASPQTLSVWRRRRTDFLMTAAMSKTALIGGLTMLRDADLRETAKAIQAPTLFLHGKRDRVVSIAAAQATAKIMPQARLTAIAAAGHLPQASHPAICARRIVEFCDA
jgi:pimeloyl-[acyl-carrier protein] methyl ester esterase